MGLFALFGSRLMKSRLALRLLGRRGSDMGLRLQYAPLSPQRLERRRVLDAGAAELLLGSALGAGDYVQTGVGQTGENLATQDAATGGDANQAPSNVELFLGASEIYENEELQLGVAFEDPNLKDSHKVIVDWGDGSAPETYVVEPGGRFVGTSHRYLDDDPTATASDARTIKVRVFDTKGKQATAAVTVQVKNVAPTIDTLSITSPIEEGQIATLTGTFSDLGTRDTFELDIDWDGDNIYDQTVEVSGGEFEVSRLFPDDNPTNTLADTFDVHVRLRDDDTGVDTDSVSLTVEDVSPFNIQIDPVEMIDENGFAQIRVTFDDTGLEDTHFARINWGDGSPLERIDLEPGQRTVVATHQYLDDNPTGTSSDSYLIRVGIINDDLGRNRATTEVLVNNVEPVLDVAANQVVDEGALLDLTGGGLGAFTDVGTRDTHTATVNWGDGTATEAVTVNQSNGAGTLDASHRYADNGLYTVTVELRDDDLGVTTKQFLVQVNNVDPSVDGVDPAPTVNEGTAFTLADLGVFLTDPGFDNPLNPNYGSVPGSQETFVGATIDWGDGTPTDTLNVINRVSGSSGVATTAEFEHAPHTYADNGLYTVTVTVGDDDGGLVQRTFQIQVNNVAPMLELTDREFVINESDTLDLFDLGVFSDPGFNNPLNTGDPSNGGEVTETFSYTIDWGDGTVETGQLPATALNGGVGVETLGTLVDSHQYLDNDADNLYTITVTLSDDDGGVVTKSILVTVLNVNPELEPVISATDVNSQGETTLTIEFADPGTETLTVWIDWGDKLALPPEDRFVPEIIVLGPGTNVLTFDHTYNGPPNPASPAADILISVFVRDDDFGEPEVIGPGQSETQMVAISNAGLGATPIVIDTTPQVPRLIFPQQEESTFFLGSTSGDEGSGQTTDLRTAVGDTKSTTDRFLELRVIDPSTGEESEGYRLKSEVLNDLPGLFRTLPDNRYAIYLVRTETNTRRLVIEVYVRNGKLIDPGDDSEGTRDRPPTDETETKIEFEPSAEDEPLLKPARPDATNSNGEEAQDQNAEEEAEPAAEDLSGKLPLGDFRRQMPQNQSSLSSPLLGTAVLGLAASKAGRSWSERIDAALAEADEKKWRQLRARKPGNQHNLRKRKND